MTLTEMRASDAAYLLPSDVAEVLRCSPQLIRCAARDDPKLLGFPVVRIGNRTKIPRRAFLDFLGEGPPGLRNDENTPFREEGGGEG